MHAPLRFVLTLLLAAGLLAPLSASALIPGVSFGGRIVSINYCVNGAVQFTVIPAGKFPITYMWLPTTRNNMFSPKPAPPPFFGQKVLGNAYPWLYFCFGPGKNPIEYVGLPVQYEGTSLTI